MGKQTSRILARKYDCKDVAVNDTYNGYVEAAYIADEDGNPIEAWRKLHDNDEQYDHYIFNIETWDSYGYQYWWTNVSFFPNVPYMEINGIIGHSSEKYFVNGIYFHLCRRNYYGLFYLSNNGFVFRHYYARDYGLKIAYGPIYQDYKMMIFGNHILASSKNTIIMTFDPDTLSITDYKEVSNSAEGYKYIVNEKENEVKLEWFPIGEYIIARRDSSVFVDTIYSIDSNGKISELLNIDNCYLYKTIEFLSDKIFLILYKNINIGGDKTTPIFRTITIDSNLNISKSSWYRNNVDSQFEYGFVKYYKDTFYIYYNIMYGSFDSLKIYSTKDFIHYNKEVEKTGTLEIKHKYEKDLPILICFSQSDYNKYKSEIGTTYKYVCKYYEICASNYGEMNDVFYGVNEKGYTNKIINSLYNCDSENPPFVYIDNMFLNDSSKNYYILPNDFFKTSSGRLYGYHNLYDYLQGITG